MWAVPEWYTFYLDLFFFYFSCPDAHLPAEQLHLNVTRVSQTHQPHGPQLPSCPSSTSSFSQVTHLGEGLCVPREQPKQNEDSHSPSAPPHPISLPTWLSSSTLLWSPLFLSVPLVIAYGALHFTLMFSWPEPPCPPRCILHGTA